MEKYWVAKKDEIVEGTCKIVKVKNSEFGIYKVKGEYYAWRNACPHFGAPVCKGVITGTRLPSKVYEYELGRENEIVRCPWHGWEFDLITGEHLVDPGNKLRQGKIGYAGAEQERLGKADLEMQSDDIYIWL
ncbi:Rieske 2Fe-2S domain-containing protein [Paenibacillus sp. LMG 31456]|uniref:Rieske 2Fe-2S domain-containing protein n=1 Tax=Paenibacillus foliorum TaxID=2654974 RepID=A0A972K293_9BACL|nr:Rieske 2Fe-2S domain-containing protein [Paenibacillus foliorum]NOU94703.1 Rieske 2Fe-2S domain-containing protein [Paenibacillus foliorum]